MATGRTPGHCAFEYREIWGSDATDRVAAPGAQGQVEAAWSPDGQRIASAGAACVPFMSVGWQEFNLVVVSDVDGSNGFTRTMSAPQESSPAWSPDSTQPAFVDDGGLVVAEAARDAVETVLAADGGEPAWSPDGTQIAYSAPGVGGQRDVYVVAATGGTPVPLTDDLADDSSPTWSPDGSQLAFESRRDGNAEVYVMDADGGNPTNLTNDPAEDTDPDWSRACPDDCTGPLGSPPSAPTAPTGVVATAGDHRVRVVFDPSEATWPVRYEVSSTAAGDPSRDTEPPIVLRHLPNRARVTATVGVASDVGPTVTTAATPVTTRCQVSPANRFTDVPRRLDGAVDWAVFEHVAEGFPDRTFRPTAPVNRAQVASMLYELVNRAGFTVFPPTEPPLRGVPHWVEIAAYWLHVEGILDGYPDGSFRPNLLVNRAQLARMIYRLAGSPDVGGLEPHGLSDVPAWADGAVTWLVDGGVMSGFSDHTFRPAQVMTRGQVVQTLHRLDCDSPWTGPASGF